MMIDLEALERIKNLIANKPIENANCFSTALYVVGLRPSVDAVDESTFHAIVSKHCRKLHANEPVLPGDIVCLTYNNHMTIPSYQHAFVTYLSGCIFHKAGPHHEPFEITSVRQVIMWYLPKLARFLTEASSVADLQRVDHRVLVFRRRKHVISPLSQCTLL